MEDRRRISDAAEGFTSSARATAPVPPNCLKMSSTLFMSPYQHHSCCCVNIIRVAASDMFAGMKTMAERLRIAREQAGFTSILLGLRFFPIERPATGQMELDFRNSRPRSKVAMAASREADAISEEVRRLKNKPRL